MKVLQRTGLEMVLLKQASKLTMHSCWWAFAHWDLLEYWWPEKSLLLMPTGFGHLDGAASAAELAQKSVEPVEAPSQQKP